MKVYVVFQEGRIAGANFDDELFLIGGRVNGVYLDEQQAKAEMERINAGCGQLFTAYATFGEAFYESFDVIG